MIADLEQLGLQSARLVAGEDAVEEVEVVEGYEFDRPVYHFDVLIDADRSILRLGLVHARLMQKLRDGLIARDDEHFPVIRLLDCTDWDKRTGA